MARDHRGCAAGEQEAASGAPPASSAMRRGAPRTAHGRLHLTRIADPTATFSRHLASRVTPLSLAGIAAHDVTMRAAPHWIKTRRPARSSQRHVCASKMRPMGHRPAQIRPRSISANMPASRMFPPATAARAASSARAQARVTAPTRRVQASHGKRHRGLSEHHRFDVQMSIVIPLTPRETPAPGR